MIYVITLKYVKVQYDIIIKIIIKGVKMKIIKRRKLLRQSV